MSVGLWKRPFATLVGSDHADKIPVMAAAYREAKVSRRRQGLDIDPLYPGARETLDRLHAREDVLLGIATGKAMRGGAALFDKHALHGRFVTIQTADTSPSKPHPDMVLQAMAETGAEPAKTLMIGDTGSTWGQVRRSPCPWRHLGLSRSLPACGTGGGPDHSCLFRAGWRP